MNKKMKTYLIYISIMSLTYLFLFPLPHLFGYNALSILIGYKNRISLSEPAIMFLIGSVLIGMGVYTKRKFNKKDSKY
jgi:predicted transporter